MKNYRLIFILLLSTFLLNGCATISGFLGGKDNTEPPAPLPEFNATLPVYLQWRRDTGEGTRGAYLRLQPVVTGNVVVVAEANGWVRTYNADDGNVIWQVRTGSEISSGPSMKNDTIVVGTRDAQVIALQRSDGLILWQAPVSNEVLAAPTLTNDKVFVISVDNNLTALDLYNGERLWQYDHFSPDLVLHANSSPQVMNDLVIAGFADGKLLAFAENSGQLVWQRAIAEPVGQTEVDRLVDIAADPIISQGVIYAVAYQGSLVAMELDTGLVLWDREFSSYTGMALSGDRLFVSDMDSTLWAFDRNNGQVVWRQEDLYARSITAPSVVGNAVVVGDIEGYLHWLSQDNGQFLARVNLDKRGSIIAPVTVKAGQVYALSNKGVLGDYQVGG
ncbi:MAG: outer membrane protein assembly factor BamB [Gammaproteobacteria bacterium]